MTAARRSLFGPIAFAFCSLVFAAGAAYTWWLDHRERPPLPLREVRAATLPALEPAAVVQAPVAPRPAASRERRARRVPELRKCLGSDGVPIFTSTACPEGATLVGEIPVDVPPSPPPSAAPPPPPAVAVANATVIQHSAGYTIPDRRFRRDARLEAAWDRCERGKLHAEAELAALRLERKMSDIRRWEKYVVHECAPYEVLTR